MNTKLIRDGKEIKLSKKCPSCNSTKFKKLKEPIEVNGYTILHKCFKCGFAWGIKIE